MASVRRSAVHLAVVPVGRAAGCSVPSDSSFISNRAVRWCRRPDKLCQPDTHCGRPRAARAACQTQPGSLSRRAHPISASRRLVRPRGSMLATQPYRASSGTHPSLAQMASEAQRPALAGCDKNSYYCESWETSDSRGSTRATSLISLPWPPFPHTVGVAHIWVCLPRNG